MSEQTIILALVLLNAVQFAALCVVVVRIAPMLPEGVVKSMLEAVKQPANVVIDGVLDAVEPVVKLTPTQFDDLALKIARDLREEIKKGAVNTPLEEK